MGRKAFLANPKHQYRVSRRKHDCNEVTKRMEIVIGIQVCLISWINIDYKENGGKNAFLVNLKHQYRVSQCGELDCCINSKKNEDYHVRQCLSHFTDEL